MPKSPEAVRAAFKSRGLRVTRQRTVIYDALAATKAHPTAEELHGMVRRIEPGLSLATVYNTLEAFSSVGLCKRLSGGAAGSASRYDADTGDHMHVTLDDGSVLDVPEDLSRELRANIDAATLDRISKSLGVSVDHLEISLRGHRS